MEQAETTCKEVEARAEKAETRSKKIEDRLQLAKTEVGKWLDAKESLIQRLRRQLAQQQETTRQNVEQVEELEEYIKEQETCFTTPLVVKEKLLEEFNENYNQQQEEWESARVTLERQCSEVEAVAEQRRLDLLIAHPKAQAPSRERNRSAHWMPTIGRRQGVLL